MASKLIEIPPSSVSLRPDGSIEIDNEALQRILATSKSPRSVSKSANGLDCVNGSCPDSSNQQRCHNTQVCDGASNSFGCKDPQEPE